MRKTTMILLATLGTTLFTSAAYAEPKKEKTENYGYSFEDDALLGGDLGAQTAVIKVRQKGTRERLIRPRVQFVSELLKSIEAL